MGYQCYLPIKDLLNIQIMSKKAQKVKEIPKVKEAEEEIDPFLKTLQKKVRNINKKLTEIQQLEGKDNLKLEQIQKVNRKQSLYEERAKVQEFATLFRESYNENLVIYRNNQLKELEGLARALVIFQSGIKIPEQDKLSSLWKAVENSGKEGNSLSESITTLATIFKDFANDRKLQKSLVTYIQVHGQTKLVVNNKVEQKQAVIEKSEVKVQAKHEVKTEPIKQTVIAKIQTSSCEPKVEQKAIVQEKVTELPQIQQTEEIKYKEDKSTKAPREKKHFKPKYTEKKPEEPKYEEQRPKEDDESSEEQPNTRNFHLDQVQKLEEEGFIVVGKSKPKPKPKDTRELKNFHDQQHGKKYHAHHVATNF